MNVNENGGIPCVLQHFPTQFALDTCFLLGSMNYPSFAGKPK